MEFKEYQDFIDETAFYPDAGKNLVYPILGLAGEAGELANRYKKILRDDAGILTLAAADDLFKELGDCLWYIAATAKEMGATIEDIARLNIIKLNKRREENTVRGSGDHR